MTDGQAGPLGLEGTIARLVQATEVNGRVVIQMPVTTQFGGGISVTLWPEGGGTFMVSDDGMAYHEALTAAASERIFVRVARDACRRYGASFDGSSMLFIRVATDRLKGAIIAMASLVKEVVDETIERSYAAKSERDREDFVRRVENAFPRGAVKEHASVVGQSTTPHEFDAVVQTDRGTLAFDYFSKAAGSISAAYLKLSDIARLEDGPRPIGATPDPAALGTKLNLITSVARVIESRSRAETLLRLAA